ncbi:hypothetical protein ACFWA9_13310 [Kitasatospora sp. NPDC059973]|uniref:hypothetical protein n=1 Tax=Kitasatospora sp. NPDC059973 TaxID=3347020 RepID=UPI003695E2E5
MTAHSPTGGGQSATAARSAQSSAVSATPAVAETRDKLLRAIGAEAQHLAQSPGQASAALQRLAHAYALTTASNLVLDLGGGTFDVSSLDFNTLPGGPGLSEADGANFLGIPDPL